jgi:hypothetical protein
MKKHLLILLYILSVFNLAVAQKNANRPKLAVLNLDTHGFSLEPRTAGNITRVELEKLELFDIMDKYDIDYLLDKDIQQADNCFGKLCLVEIGKKSRPIRC